VGGDGGAGGAASVTGTNVQASGGTGGAGGDGAVGGDGGAGGNALANGNPTSQATGGDGGNGGTSGGLGGAGGTGTAIGGGTATNGANGAAGGAGGAGGAPLLGALSAFFFDLFDGGDAGDLPPEAGGEGNSTPSEPLAGIENSNSGDPVESTEPPVMDLGPVAFSLAPPPDPIQGGAGILFTGTTGQTLVVNNTGTIAGGNGTVGGYGIHITGGNAMILNAASGVISSPLLAAIYSSSADGVVVSNYGTISSPTKAISFTGGVNSLTLYANSTTLGALEFNELSGAESLTFSGLLGNFSNSITGLNSITATDGAQVTLNASIYTLVNGSVAVDGTSALTIAGSLQNWDGPISSITKTGAGNLTLTGNNTYSGNTNVAGGTLFLSGIGTLGTSTVSISGGTLDLGGKSLTNPFGNLTGGTLANGTLTNDGANYDLRNGTISAILAGNNGVAKTTSGMVVLSANNTYTAGTTISSGILWANNPQALGKGGATINGGTLLVTSSQEPSMGSKPVSDFTIAQNVDWSSGTIAFYDTDSSPEQRSLTINVGGNFTVSTVGNATFDFSQVAALSFGNYTLVNATLVTADNNKFTAAHGPLTTLFGNFSTTNQTVVYTVTGAVSGGPNIQNYGGPNTPLVANYNVSGPTISVAQTEEVNGLNFSNSAPLTINATGQLIVASGALGVQSGSSVVSGGTLVTPGNLDKTGAGELDLQSNANVNGIANVVAGLLSVNGQLTTTGGLVVDPGATLGGAGFIIGNVAVIGNLSPGNSPGTLNVVGNLVLGAGSSTVIEIASSTNLDRIIVSGTATLGGTLNAVAYGGGTITPGARYDFLQAGSIDGEFDSLIAPDGLRIRFLNSGTVGTLLFGPESFVPYAINQNQINVAKALDTFVLATSGDAVIVGTALDSLTTEQFPVAFDQIMPGFYESLANIAIEQAFNQTQMLNQRISSVRLGAAGFQAIGGITQPLLHDKNGKSAADAKDASPIVESATATNWNAWALGTGMFSRTTDLGRLQNYNNDAGGFLVGSDYRWSENFVTGLYAGYDYSYAEYNGGGSTKGNNFSFGTYASYEKDGYYADAVIGGGYTGFQTKRSIEFSTIDRTASADPNSGQFTAGLNFGKDFEVGKFTLGPIVGAQYTYAGIGSFTESGAESLDLSLGQQNANSLRTTLGGRIAYTWNMNQKIAFIPEVRMFWQHEFLNNPRNISSSLDGGSGAAFDFETSDPYRDSVFAGAGVTAQFGKNLSGSVFYNINFGSQTYQSNMVSAGLNFSF
jgi:outer membrane autotransporter protein